MSLFFTLLLYEYIKHCGNISAFSLIFNHRNFWQMPHVIMIIDFPQILSPIVQPKERKNHVCHATAMRQEICRSQLLVSSKGRFFSESILSSVKSNVPFRDLEEITTNRLCYDSNNREVVKGLFVTVMPKSSADTLDDT